MNPNNEGDNYYDLPHIYGSLLAGHEEQMPDDGVREVYDSLVVSEVLSCKDSSSARSYEVRGFVIAHRDNVDLGGDGETRRLRPGGVNIAFVTRAELEQIELAPDTAMSNRNYTSVGADWEQRAKRTFGMRAAYTLYQSATAQDGDNDDVIDDIINKLVSNDSVVQLELSKQHEKELGILVVAMPSVAEELDYYEVAEYYAVMTEVPIPGGELFIGVINPEYIPSRIMEKIDTERATPGFCVVTVDGKGDRVQFNATFILQMRTN